MRSEAQKQADKKYKQKLKNIGKEQTITIKTDIQTKDNITDFCTIANISKAEFLRKLSAKIDDGSLYTFLNIDVDAARAENNE